MCDIYVIDTETTGLNGIEEGDTIVEVGVARVNMTLGRVYPMFNFLVGQYIPEDRRHAWIFEHTDLTVDDLARASMDADIVSEVLQSMLTGCAVTSYNTEFDFDRFLFQDPWRMNAYTRRAPCIMETAARFVGTCDHAGGSRWPSLQSAYNQLCPEDPADLNGPEKHRAMWDAVMAGHVLVKLIRHDEVYESYREVSM